MNHRGAGEFLPVRSQIFILLRLFLPSALFSFSSPFSLMAINGDKLAKGKLLHFWKQFIDYFWRMAI